MRYLSIVWGMLISGLISAQSISPLFYHTNGIIRTSYVDSATNNLYIGGTFDYVGPNQPFVAISDTVGNGINLHFGIDDCFVNTVCSDNNGGWFVGGMFTMVKGVTRNNIVHFDSLGNVLPTNISASSTVYALKCSGDTLFIGGAFTTINSITRNRIAAYRISTSSLLPWNPNANNPVTALEIGPSYVFAGGDFTTIGGLTRPRAAKLDRSTGTAFTWNPNPDLSVSYFKVVGTYVYVYGQFGTIGGQTRNRIARLDFTTGLADAWYPTITGGINCMAVTNDTIFLGGVFTNVNSTARNNFAAVNSANVLLSFYPIFNGGINAIRIHKDRFAVSGGFSTINGLSNFRNAIVKISNGQPLSNTVHGDAQALNIGHFKNRFYWWGNFMMFDGEYHRNIASLSIPDGKLNSAFTANMNAAVLDLQVFKGKLYAAGQFTQANGLGRTFVAQLDTSTGATLPFIANCSGSYVQRLEAYGDTLFIGGNFSTVNSLSRPNLAAVVISTGAVLSWSPSPNNYVLDLLVHNNKLYLGGAFFATSTTQRPKLARYSLPGLTLDAFNPNNGSGIASIGSVLTSWIQNDTMFVAGSFDVFNGSPRNRLAAVSLITNSALPYNPVPGPLSSTDFIFDIAANNDYLFCAGTGGWMGTYSLRGKPVNFIPDVNSSSTPYASNTVSLYHDMLYLGGDFDDVIMSGTKYRRTNLAAFCLPLANAGFVDFDNDVCSDTNSIFYTYTIPVIDGAVDYSWNYSGTGVIITPGDTSCLVEFTPSATSGTLSVVPYGLCGAGTPIVLSIVVTPNPHINIGSYDTVYCNNENSVSLNLGTPAGGSYTINGSPQLVLNPMNYSPGIHEMIYTITGYNSCPSKDTMPFEIYLVDSALFVPSSDSVCAEGGLFNLNGESPTGGVFSGSGVSGSQLNPAISGNGLIPVYYTFTNGFGCTDSTVHNFYVDSCLSLSHDSNNELSIQLFPNPASDHLTIISNQSEIGAMKIINGKGEIVLSERINSNLQEINIKSLSKGIYYIEVYSGDSIQRRKFIKR